MSLATCASTTLSALFICKGNWFCRNELRMTTDMRFRLLVISNPCKMSLSTGSIEDCGRDDATKPP
ncbi:hypothetical protein H310_02017 [Aphanomyces invadans]|uniref:Uncharacterized protein n=1 Tax=Aphanomyces invadans TaxID=157072 RepID=A0A024UM42_9STRA|nr:hypothetical protein H310_02017 [Aphanomyces invadans]ETW07516.1 hypothetical protein H310_02017 [Aphanomyces invadans]|eukprot:XP_008863609.1 hypothetical protein H310_02017 [Aphanomyces invadans]